MIGEIIAKVRREKLHPLMVELLAELDPVIEAEASRAEAKHRDEYAIYVLAYAPESDPLLHSIRKFQSQARTRLNNQNCAMMPDELRNFFGDLKPESLFG